jgi:hypothetical protein
MALVAPRAINLSAILGDVSLRSLKAISVQIFGEVFERGAQPGQVTGDGQTKMEIAKWDKRREQYVIVALSDLANIGEHYSFMVLLAICGIGFDEVDVVTIWLGRPSKFPRWA